MLLPGVAARVIGGRGFVITAANVVRRQAANPSCWWFGSFIWDQTHTGVDDGNAVG